MQWLPVQSTGNGVLSAPMVSARRFHGGGCRPVFGLWAAYSVAASRLHRDSAWLAPCNISFPSPLRDSAGFTPASRLTNPNRSLTCTGSFYMWNASHSGMLTVLRETGIFVRYPQFIGCCNPTGHKIQWFRSWVSPDGGRKGNPVKVRNCPAAVSRYERQYDTEPVAWEVGQVGLNL
jgi:hypothetical protein